MAIAANLTDPSLLKGIKGGDKVMFQPERVNGQLAVTKIEKANPGQSLGGW
jgi:Cu/Ag efflux protein CusF